MKTITNFAYKNNSFVIVYHKDLYWAVSTDIIDADGKLMQELNAVTTPTSTELPMCLIITKQRIEMREMIANGMDTVQAAYNASTMFMDEYKKE